jgi:hypothetical protein
MLYESTVPAAVAEGRTHTPASDAGTGAAAVTPWPRAAADPVALKALATLPASGAYESAPLHTAMVAIPLGREWALVGVTYTEGASGGYMGAKVWGYDGAAVFQLMAPDGTYAGIAGSAGTSKFLIRVRIHGLAKIGITGAEVGVTATPGTHVSTVVFA